MLFSKRVYGQRICLFISQQEQY